jgi:hypothetical protein
MGEPINNVLSPVLICGCHRQCVSGDIEFRRVKPRRRVECRLDLHRIRLRLQVRATKFEPKDLHATFDSANRLSVRNSPYEPPGRNALPPKSTSRRQLGGIQLPVRSEAIWVGPARLPACGEVGPHRRAGTASPPYTPRPTPRARSAGA